MEKLTITAIAEKAGLTLGEQLWVNQQNGQHEFRDKSVEARYQQAINDLLGK